MQGMEVNTPLDSHSTQHMSLLWELLSVLSIWTPGGHIVLCTPARSQEGVI